MDAGLEGISRSIGLILLPSGIAGVLSGLAGGALIRRRGPRSALIVGTALLASCYAVLLVWRGSVWHLVLAGALLGLGSPFNHAAVNTMLVTGVRMSESGVAMGMNTVMRSLGMVIGAQGSAVILSGDTLPGTTMPTEDAFVAAFAACLALGLVAAGISLLAPARRRAARTPPTLVRTEPER